MKCSRFRSPSVLLAIFVLLTAYRAAAEDSEYTRNTLRGITGVSVLVERLTDQAEQDGLRKEDIQTDVELKLRLAGIKVLSGKASYANPGGPYLYVEVTAILSSTGLYAVSTGVSLKQDVLLARDQSTSIAASTWSTDSVVTVGRTRLRNLRDSIKEDVDEFINAYLSVNPKK